MSRIFYKLGRLAGPSVRKAKWIWQAAASSEAKAIKAEYEVGRDMAYDIRHRLSLDPDLQTGQILNEVGCHLASCVANKHRSFSFESIKGLGPEAFCLPGGFIFVSRSLVELCRWNKDEIAFILGHEMAHVIQGHVMERMISNSAVAAASRAAPVRDAFTACLRKVGIKFLEAAYSQDQESEADRLGIRLAVSAGYDPHGATRLLSRIAKSQDKSRLASYFSSHPACDVRINNINCYLDQ
jgi:predicted Zn-dependent protease